MNSKKHATIGIALITHAAKKHLPFSLTPYLESPLKPRVLVVNSSSNDGTVEEAKKLGAETLIIPRNEFNHGSTRERARKYLQTEIVVMTTPDAYPIDKMMLEKLVTPLLEEKASVSYARQIAHEGADLFESFPRAFNYPESSHVRGIENIDKYGIYTFFCSDSCAAYKNSALNEIGGFRPVLTMEDYLAVAMLLQKGHKIAYVAQAVVRHSHRYSLWQEFKRYFDTGYARRENLKFVKITGSAEKRGRDFSMQFLKELYRKQPLMFPYGVLHTGIKWLGYRAGLVGKYFPIWLKKKLSGQDYYWTSKNFVERGG